VTDRRQEMRAEIQVPEQEGVAHRSEMGRLRPTLLCSERERDLGIMSGKDKESFWCGWKFEMSTTSLTDRLTLKKLALNLS
jgi:hypothetical protein